MDALQRFYRRNFWPCGKVQLFDLLESESDVVTGIVLEEVGPPGRGRDFASLVETPLMINHAGADQRRQMRTDSI
jgi:hypothetical protein